MMYYVIAAAVSLTSAILSAVYLVAVIRSEVQEIQPISILLRRRSVIFVLGLSLFMGMSLFFVARSVHGYSLFEAYKALLIFELLVPASWYDYKYHIIKNKFILLALALAVALFAVEYVVSSEDVLYMLKEYGFGLLIGAGIFLLSALIARGSVGMGDVKLFAVLGLMLGWERVYMTILLSVIVVAVYGVTMIIAKKKNRKSQVAIGPFALVGFTLMILMGG